MLSPLAYYDSLYVVSSLGDTQPPPGFGDVHVVAYLACLLSLYDGNPISMWGYQLAMAEGRPFSAALEDAIDRLQSLGCISQGEHGELTPTEAARAELSSLAKLRSFSKREPFLSGACSAVLTQPAGIARNALLHDPQLRPLNRLGSSRMLFQEPGIGQLYRQFDELRQGIQFQPSELMVPAVLWLAYFDHVAALETGDQDAEG
ncbi:MAG: hypothetical protein ABIP48_05170 [Planctomycetota bacterium]